MRKRNQDSFGTADVARCHPTLTFRAGRHLLFYKNGNQCSLDKNGLNDRVPTGTEGPS